MSLSDNKVFKLFKLLNVAFVGYKWRILVIAVLSFLSGILEGIGINTIIPVFSLINGRHGEDADMISQVIEKMFLYFNINFTVKFLLVFIMSLFIARTIILFVNQYITVKISSDYVRKTRSELFKNMLYSDWPFLSKQKIGYLEQILITDVNTSAGVLVHTGSAILVIANLLVYGFLIFNISTTIALLVFAFGVILFLFLKPLFHKNRAASGEIVQKNKEVSHFVGENIIGMKLIKSMASEKPILQKSLNYFERMRKLTVRISLLNSFTAILMQPIGMLFVLGIFALFYKSEAFNFASFAVIIYAINKVFSGLQMAQGEAHDFSSRAPSLMSVLSYRNEAAKNKERDPGVKAFSFKSGMEFKNVSFFYDDKARILDGVSFSVKHGEMLGLVGPSGAGKTTMVDLLLRLLKPQEGNIFLDGEDVSNISLEEWRTNLGYVSQDIFLINDTITNNIKFYNGTVTEKDVLDSAKMANIYDFVMTLPEQFNTMVGERGLRLSNGQRQRIVLARILARKPKLLVLDEATSALDNESEMLIQKSIEELKGKVTVVAIAHRLSTVANFDKLVVLEDGKIIEEGAPQELLRDEKSYFSKVYNLKKN